MALESLNLLTETEKNYTTFHSIKTLHFFSNILSRLVSTKANGFEQRIHVFIENISQ